MRTFAEALQTERIDPQRVRELNEFMLGARVERDRLVKSLIERGWGINALAAEVGLDKATVSRIARR